MLLALMLDQLTHVIWLTKQRDVDKVMRKGKEKKDCEEIKKGNEGEETENRG